MVFSKEHLYAIADQLPPEFELDELIEKLLILSRLKQGQRTFKKAAPIHRKKSKKWSGHGAFNNLV